MEFQRVRKSMIENGKVVDAITTDGYWIPLIKNAKIETTIEEGHRFVTINGEKFKFHRSIHEIGRPQLFNETLELMAALNV